MQSQIVTLVNLILLLEESEEVCVISIMTDLLHFACV